jgi:SAM-dependent methyltransferase
MEIGESYLSRYKLPPITKLGEHRERTWQANLFEGLFPHLDRGISILEIGSGRGEFADECKQRGYKYTGIEPSEELSQLLIKKGFNILKSRVPPINLSNNAYDFIYSMDLVEHLPSYKEVLELFIECFRVVKKDGYVCIITPNYSTLKELFFEYEYQHSFPTTESRLLRLFEDSGFRIVKHRAFLISPGMRRYYQYLDRLLAHALIPIVRNMMIRNIIKFCFGRNFLFRVHKNLYDHIGVLVQKV